MRIKPLHFRIAAIAIVAVAVASAIVALNRPEAGAAKQSTDDAYVRADSTAIVPQVAGVITAVAVVDHQQVEAGDLLVAIDERELRIALANADAQIARAEASIASLEAQVGRQQGAIEQARAAVAASSANLRLAEADSRRFADLARERLASQQSAQQAEAHRDVQRAARERDQAGLQSAHRQTSVLEADLAEARAALRAAQAERDAAELALSHAQVRAPVAGVVAQRSARIGGYARVGEPLLTLVPLDAVYVEANFRETQLARVQVGQPVEVEVDALPGVRLQGRVESLAPASGASFSPIAGQNATGNFTKITQRLPVRIHLEPGQEAANALRVGMSVRPTIHTATAPAAQRATAGSGHGDGRGGSAAIARAAH